MRTTSTFLLCSTLLLLLLSSVLIAARSVPALHHDVDGANPQHEHAQSNDETVATDTDTVAATASTISIKITSGHSHERAHDHHQTPQTHQTHRHSHHGHIKDVTTCTLEQCKVQPPSGTSTNICGSDGKVYYNDCLFRNAQCNKRNTHGTELTSVANWDGNHCPSTCTKPIVCQEIGMFFCGSDGNAYYGYCPLYAAQCVDATLQEIPCPPGLIEYPSRD